MVSLPKPHNYPPAFAESNATFELVENHIEVLSLAATDRDVNDTLIYSMSGPDASLFILNPASGDLSFATRPDFESPGDANGDNLYELTVTASDGKESTDQPVYVTIKDGYDGTWTKITDSNATNGIDWDVSIDLEDDLLGVATWRQAHLLSY